MDETEVETVVRLRAADVRDLFPAAAADDADSRVCSLCAATLKDKTHNLTRHLERRHAAALLQLLEQRAAAAAATPSNAASAPTPKKARVRASKAAAAAVTVAAAAVAAASPVAAKKRAAAVGSNKRRHDALVESDTDSDDTVAAAAAKLEEQSSRAEAARLALVRWLALEQLPLALVESDGFRAFTRALNGRFGALASGDVQRMLADMQRSADATPLLKLQAQDHEQLAETPETHTHRPPIVVTRALVATARTNDDASCVQLQQLPCSALASGHVRVHVNAALATHWDARASRGELCGRRGVLGRAFVGVVAQMHERDPSASREHERVVLGATRLRPSRSGDTEAAAGLTRSFGVDAARGALSEVVDVPESALYSLPAALPDDLALLTSDVALVVRIAAELQRRKATMLAILTDGVAGCLTTLLARFVRQELGLACKDVRVIAVGSMDDKLATQLAQFATLETPSEETAPDTAPVVVDVCGSDASAELAVRLTEPMGALLLVDRQRFEAASAVVAMDMNAVVVNELELVAIGDCSSDDDAPDDASPTAVDAAIAYLETQVQKGCAEELRALLSPPVALDAALGELRALPLESFYAQYLHVKVSTPTDA